MSHSRNPEISRGQQLRDLHPDGTTGKAIVVGEKHVIRRRSDRRTGRSRHSDPILLGHAGVHGRRDSELQQSLALGERVSGERARDQIQIHHRAVAGSCGQADDHAEGLPVPDLVRVRDESGPVGAVNRCGIRRREGLHSELGRESARECVELVRIAARDENSPVGNQNGGGVVHPGNGGRSVGEKSTPQGVARKVGHGVQDGEGREAPSL
ncbi:hypothetical protein Mapa_014488 [Marchantia paleacea]|nr:hypothetical protein Mapa_014488 [Marchantia paleacea]